MPTAIKIDAITSRLQSVPTVIILRSTVISLLPERMGYDSNVWTAQRTPSVTVLGMVFPSPFHIYMNAYSLSVIHSNNAALI